MKMTIYYNIVIYKFITKELFLSLLQHINRFSIRKILLSSVSITASQNQTQGEIIIVFELCFNHLLFYY